MNKKITQIGNSWGIIIPKTLFDMLKINPVKDKLDIKLENDKLILTKAPEENR